MAELFKRVDLPYLIDGDDRGGWWVWKCRGHQGAVGYVNADGAVQDRATGSALYRTFEDAAAVVNRLKLTERPDPRTHGKE